MVLFQKDFMNMPIGGRAIYYFSNISVSTFLSRIYRNDERGKRSWVFTMYICLAWNNISSKQAFLAFFILILQKSKYYGLQRRKVELK